MGIFNYFITFFIVLCNLSILVINILLIMYIIKYIINKKNKSNVVNNFEEHELL